MMIQDVERSFPSSHVVIARSLFELVRSEVVLQLRQSPHSLPVLGQLRESLQDVLAQQGQSLEEVGQSKIYPGDSASNVLLIPQNTVQLLEVGLKIFRSVCKGTLEGVLLVVGGIDHLDVHGMEVLVDSMNRGHGDLLIEVSTHQFGFVAFIADVDADGVAFGDDLLSIDEVGEGDGWVPVLQFGFVLCEPLVPALRPLVEDLSVGDGAVLQELSQSFGQSSNSPIAQLDSLSLHQQDMLIFDITPSIPTFTYITSHFKISLQPLPTYTI